MQSKSLRRRSTGRPAIIKEVVSLNFDDIKREVACLKRINYTNNPFDIAASKNILILYEELGSVNGYYNKVFRQKQIHINNDLTRLQKYFTCAHELRHAIMDPETNTPFLRNNTYLSVDKMEIRANKFAVELLIDDVFLLENWQYTTEQIARMLGYQKELIELRLE